MRGTRHSEEQIIGILKQAGSWGVGSKCLILYFRLCLSIYGTICLNTHDMICLNLSGPDWSHFAMPAPNEKLAASLPALPKRQEGGRRVLQSDELSRLDRERLLRTGFLHEVMKGWLISSSPDAR